VQELASSGAQIVFLFVQAGTGGIFLREAAAQGLFGGESGFVYIVGDSMAGNANSLIESLTTSSTECSGFGASGNLLCTPGLPNEEVGAAVKGMLGVAPLVENDRLDSFMTRYSALTPTTASCGTNPVTVGIDCSCADGEDSVGTKVSKDLTHHYACDSKPLRSSLRPPLSFGALTTMWIPLRQIR